MTIRNLLAAVGFNCIVGLFVYSLWAEWGPYAWIAGAQMAVMNSYSSKLTFLCTGIVFALPAFITLGESLESSRPIRIVAIGPTALAIVAHFCATVYFLVTGGIPASNVTYDEAVATATLLPHAVILNKSELPAFDTKHGSGITHSSSDNSDVFIPFVSSTSAPTQLPVLLASTKFLLHPWSPDAPLTGTVRKAPAPYLVRRAGTTNGRTLCIVFAQSGTVRDVWIPGAIFYVVIAIFWVKGRNKPTQKPPLPVQLDHSGAAAAP